MPLEVAGCRRDSWLPVTEINLDSSAQTESVTLIHGKNVLLKLVEDEETKRLLETKDVAEFLSTQDICWKDFRATMLRLVDRVKQTRQDLNEQVSRSLYMSTREVLLRELSPKPTDLLNLKIPPKTIREQKRMLNSMMRKIEREDKELLELQKKLRAHNPKLEVLEPQVILRCPTCGFPRFGIEEQSGSLPRTEPPFRFLSRRLGGRVVVIPGETMGVTKCGLCKAEFPRERAIRIHLHKIKDSILKVWTSNLWLEEHIARLLRSLGWQTWIHVNVLGASGVRHEIDVLGVKKSYVMVCECKTGPVGRQGVFNFWAKVDDIKSHVSLLALVEELPEPETREFVEKNLSVVLLEALGNMKRQKILDTLRGSVVGKIHPSKEEPRP